jgi:hypothetical protein
MKPTPTPWKTGRATLGALPCIAQLNGKVIAVLQGPIGDTEQLANAEHIVRCVNSFEELLQACRESLAWFDEVYPADVFESKSDRIVEMRELCRAAIRKAEQKP